MKLSLLTSVVLALVLFLETSPADAFLHTAKRWHRSSRVARLATPVEQVDFETVQVINVFASQAEAARNVNGVCQVSISDVIHGRAKSAGGYFWRRKGDTAAVPIPRKKNANPNREEVEQIDMETLEVINVYPSSYQAAAAIGGNYQGILRVVNKMKDRSSYKGYYWRRAGDKSPPRESNNLSQKISHLRQRVQQIDPESGEVIATFDSISEAHDALGIQPQTISKVLRGVQGSAGGYHFRKVGRPQKFKRNYQRRPMHQICKETGIILATFPSSRAAGIAMGVSSSSISAAVRGKTKSSAGYRWMYVEDYDEEIKAKGS